MDGRKLREMRTKLERLKIRRETLEEDLVSKEEELKYWEDRHEKSSEFKLVVQKVAKEVQQELEFKVSKLISGALAAVPLKGNPQFLLEFVTRRGQPEADIWLITEGEKSDPLEDNSGGACDITSLAGLCVIKRLSGTRQVLFLDEPLKHLSAGLQSYASDMLKMLCDELGLQIIMISHNPKIIKEANNIIEIN